jgi:hypothetical protein
MYTTVTKLIDRTSPVSWYLRAFMQQFFHAGFGIGGMILDGLVFGQFVVENRCGVDVAEIIRPASQLVFTFMQMYFVFRNSKVINTYCVKASNIGSLERLQRHVCM